MTQQDIEDFGIETWVDTHNRLFLSDPERDGDAPQAFRLPVKTEGKVFAVLVFQYRLTVKGRRIFQAEALLPADCQMPHPPALWSDVLGLRQAETSRKSATNSSAQ